MYRVNWGVCFGKHMSSHLSLLFCSCQCHIYRLLCCQRYQFLGVIQQQKAFIGVLDQLATTEVDLSLACKASACVACVSLVDVVHECRMVWTDNEREIERDRERGTERGAGCETSQLGVSLNRDKSSQCEAQRSDFFWLAVPTLWLLSRPFGHTVPTKRAGPWLEACVVVFLQFATQRICLANLTQGHVSSFQARWRWCWETSSLHFTSLSFLLCLIVVRWEVRAV